MRGIAIRILVLLVIGTYTCVLAFGKITKKEVTFTQTVTVDGTSIKKGTYEVSFNDETGELTVKRGKKVVAKAQARLEKGDSRYSFFTRTDANDPSKQPALVSVYFNNGNQATIVNTANTGDGNNTSGRP